ncbi:helical backbone metal receptor [Ferviditalea candida]|uniref:Helical backbone metal receptor n=1 Tax=Ferviditalea candida TaxID=3108399 RepID=A0ABU5ZMM3_9BACL|nr:helical backbone metal receptor [Paenibacillaceae bacterium T2]
MTLKVVQDHLQRPVSFMYPPRKIISLCPSITETLYALGLGGQIAGRTRYCIHPADQVKQAAIVGGTKQVKEELISRLQPDLIIAEKEENSKDMVEHLAEHFPVYACNVENFDDALKMIHDLGVICNREEAADKMASAVIEQFGHLQPSRAGRAAYVIWRNPYMVAGGRTFIDSILKKSGFNNVFRDLLERYPVVTIEDFLREKPDFILLSSEPYPFKDQHKEEFLQQVPGAKPVLVDGESFSWYGVHMIKTPAYLNALLKEMI